MPFVSWPESTPCSRPMWTKPFLRRLATYSRKNKLYFAFRELGRVVRTVFLLCLATQIGRLSDNQNSREKAEDDVLRNRARWG